MDKFIKDLIKDVRKDVYKNNRIHVYGLLYVLSTPIGLIASLSSIKLGLEILKGKHKFNIYSFYISLITCFMYGIKLPYMYDKKIAFISLLISFIFWLISSIIFIYLFIHDILSKKLK